MVPCDGDEVQDRKRERKVRFVSNPGTSTTVTSSLRRLFYCLLDWETKDDDKTGVTKKVSEQVVCQRLTTDSRERKNSKETVYCHFSFYSTM